MIVVDASVLVKCYLHEIYSDECYRLMMMNCPLAVPDIALSQVASVLWRRNRTGELRPGEAQKILSNLARLPIEYVPISVLAEQAMDLSTFSRRSFNESLYFVLALRYQTKVISADHRWCSYLSTGKLKPYVEFVCDTIATMDGRQNGQGTLDY